MTATVDADPDTAALRMPVWNTLAERADALRRALPSRPQTAAERCGWLRSLTPAQARRAALLDRLDALCGHLAGRPALGYSPDDPMPAAALEEAEGFNPHLTRLIARYRASRPGPDTAVVS
ncbi:hypothetical protein [Streptomyces lydicus]|uniref:hypothetical protein n=1 Tax=Streptomyces lydicus TaxID=47763 RepID=UPI0010136574|nr:hypothetical protein [Streptomyces lydicus]MCZ1011939.1 hypothetical protein [Streptomyces lydicus]